MDLDIGFGLSSNNLFANRICYCIMYSYGNLTLLCDLQNHNVIGVFVIGSGYR